MFEKMNDPECVAKRVKIIPPNYSKENFLAMFTPQTQLTLEQVFWSLDLEKRKAEELKANTSPLRKLAAATVTSKDAPEFDAFFELNKKEAQLQNHRNTIHKLKAQISHLKANKTDVTGTLLPQPLENKHVTFAEPLETLNHSTSKPVQHPEVKKSNVPINSSTEVNSDTKASRSKPRRNIKNDRTSTAKSVPKKKVEDHIRNTKSDLHKQNRVDSSISLKRTVVNLIFDSRCKTCTKCIILSNHDKCVEKFLKSSNKPPVKKVWRVKQVKQTWKATGKLFANVGYQWKLTGRKFTLGEQCHLTGITKPKVVHVRQWKPTGRIIPLGEKCPVTKSIASTSALIVVETQTPIVPIVPDNACTNQLDPNNN
ncbi:hypothetical protein Tco_1163742 [Tanacetum coccineum]